MRLSYVLVNCSKYWHLFLQRNEAHTHKFTKELQKILLRKNEELTKGRNREQGVRQSRERGREREKRERDWERRREKKEKWKEKKVKREKNLCP